MSRLRARCCGAWVALCVWLVPMAAAADPQGALERGVAWLGGQVTADGRLADEAAAIALPQQSRAEALHSLALLEAAPASLRARVEAGQAPDHELRMRRQLALRIAGATLDPLALPAGAQNADGGFGAAVGHASTPLDSALTLLALAREPAADLQAVGRALGYLRASTAADGGVGVHAQARIAVTAHALAAANAWRQRFEVGDQAQRAVSWLLAQRNAAGAFEGTENNALVLLALLGHSSDAALREPLVQALLAAQSAAGDWHGDVYQSALALRALARLTQPPSPPGGASLTGRLIDAGTGVGVAGASLRLLERAESVTSSSSDGGFSLHEIPAGSYRLQIEAVGYASRSIDLTIASGQLVQLGNVLMQPASLSAALSGTVRTTTGAALADVLVSVGTANATTNAAGAYRLLGLNPGPATITVSRTGYRTQSVNAEFVAGTEHVFSPTMIASSATPPSDASLKGRLLNASSGAAIAGATISSGGRSVLSGADGRFTLTQLAVGPFEAQLSATGFAGAALSGSLAGGVNDAGDIRLQPVPDSSILVGNVTDIDSGAAVAGATVGVAGTALSAATDAAGAFRLEGIANTSFRLRVEADGYAPAVFDLVVPQHGTHRFDPKLAPAVDAGGLSFREIRTSQPQYSPYEEFELEVEVHNATEQDRELVIDALVMDAAGQVSFELRANAFGLGQNPPNLPIAIPAGALLEVEMERVLLRQPAGAYTVHVRGSDTSGRLLLQGTATFSVRAQPLLAGGLTVEPPLLHAGTGESVQFTAELANTGNLPIPAGDYRMTVTLEAADTVTSTEPRIELFKQHVGTPLRNPRGAIADADGNVYVINNGDGKLLKVAPDGTIAVRATIPVNAGGDVAREPDGTLWVSEWNGARLWRFDPAGVRSEQRSTALQRIRSIALQADGSLLLVGEFSAPSGIEYRLVRRASDGSEAILWSNGLAEPVAVVFAADGSAIVANRRDNTLSRVLADGRVEPWLDGFNRPAGLALAGDGTLYVSNGDAGTVERIDADGSRSLLASGLSQPGELALAPGGELFVVNRGDHSILRIPSPGVVELFARGIANGPQGLRHDAEGGLLIANDDGSLRRLAPDGQLDVLASGIAAPRGMAVQADGAVMVASYSTGTIKRVEGGAVDTHASGLSGPFGVVEADGGLWVTEYNAHRLTRLDADGTVVERVSTVVNAPQRLRVDAAGRLFAINSGFVTVREGDATRLLSSGRSYTDLAPDGDGGFVAVLSRDVYRVAADGTETRIAAALPFTIYGVALDADGSILLRDYSGRRIQRLHEDGTLSIVATLTDYPNELVGDTDGRVYIRTNTNKLLRLEPDGSVVQVAAFQYFYLLGTGANGELLVHTYDNTNRYHVRQVDPDTGTSVPLQRTDPVVGYASATGLALLADGRLAMADQVNRRQVVFDGGVIVDELASFMNPTDIVADGNRLLFVDSTYLYSFEPGGYPERLGAFPAVYLTLRNGQLIGASNGNLVRWIGPSYQNFNVIPGATTLRGVSATGDGRLFAAVNGESRIVELSPTNAVLNDYAGIVSPIGLAFDGSGALHVASAGPQTVLRLGAAGEPARLVARGVSGVRHLRFDDAGALWATRSNMLSRINVATGVLTNLATVTGASFWGLDVRNGEVLVTDSNLNQLRRYTGGSLQVLAAGLHNVNALRVEADGSALLAGTGNGTLSRYQAGRFGIVASGLGAPNALAIGADGRVVIAGNTGAAFVLSEDGSLRDARIAPIVGNANLSALAARPADYLLFDPTSNGTLHRLSISQTPPPPPIGTVVHEVLRSAGPLPADEELLTIDFGRWVPPYGGDFRARVERDDVEGSANNFVHVGGHASGMLTTSTPRVAAGDRTVPLRLQLTGADFTSISRVETAGFRRVVGISFPKGISADRAGNIYFTDTAAVRKVATDGTTSVLAGGIAPQFGLVTDSQERLYLPNRTPTGRYQLLRIDLEGNSEVLVDLGTAQVNGIGVNSHDQILIGRANALLRFDPSDGSMTTVTTVGIGTPLGLAVDGRDNVFVQNNAHMVVQVQPDGRTRTIFSRRDGVDEPVFEGDGYPTITADCADNFYITASQWARVGQNGEERVLTQVVPRTGQIVGLLDVSKVDSRVGDIDYLAFDRFNSRILMWDHNTSAIYQIPVTCGAIGVDVHLLTRAGQSLQGFDLTPSASVALADGRTEYVWSLRDVGADGVSLNFDTLLRDLQLGERRPAIDSGHLNFRNSFAPADIRVPLAIPQIEVENIIDLTLATDQPEYRAGQVADVLATLHNSDSEAVVGTLRVEVRDGSGEWVGVVLTEDVTIEAGATLPVAGPFAIGAILPGPYLAHAELSRDGLALARASAPFNVFADNEAGAASARLQLDRDRYRSGEQVGITSHVLSQSANLPLNELLLQLRVFDPQGVERASYVHGIAQLLPSATRSFVNGFALLGAEAGQWRVEQVLSDAYGRHLDVKTAPFEVLSDEVSGDGLRGSLVADPAQALVGTPVRFDFEIVNEANAAFTALPVRVVLLDLGDEREVWRWEGTVDLARDDRFAGSELWASGDTPAGHYSAVLLAEVGGTERLLARADVVLTELDVAIEASQELQRDSQLLVLVGCPPNRADCSSARIAFLEAYLTDLGVVHRIVDNVAAFEREFASGRWNTYWISGEWQRLGQDLSDQLIEAAFRGDGLIADGEHDARNHLLDPVLGFRFRGKLPHADYEVTLAGSELFPADRFLGRGSAARYELAGATVHGRYSASASDPAVLSAGFGLGRSVTFGFDLVDTLMQAPDSPLLRTLLDASLQHVMPLLPERFIAGAFVPLTTRVQNLGAAVELDVRLDVPSEARIETHAPSAAEHSAQHLLWRLGLEEDASIDLDAGLRLLEPTPALALETRVSVTGSPDIPLQVLRTHIPVLALAEHGANTLQAIRSLAPTAPSQLNARDRAAGHYADALRLAESADYGGALSALLRAREDLLRISSVDITAARLGLDETMRSMAFRWYRQQSEE